MQGKQTNKLVGVVSDDEADHLALRRVFKSVGGEVRFWTYPDEALNALEGGAEPDIPDVLLVDVRLPDRSGAELITALRALPGAARDLPVIVLTGLEHDPLADEALNAGANTVLVKPSSLRDLDKLVLQALDMPSGHQHP